MTAPNYLKNNTARQELKLYHAPLYIYVHIQYENETPHAYIQNEQKKLAQD